MWNSSPAVADGIVYAANVEGELHALDAASGEPLWEGEGTSTPTIAGGSVYVGETDGHFYRYDAKTGKRKWKTRMGGTIGAAAVSDGLVLVGAYHQFYVTAEKRFRYQFVALGAEDGKTRWVVETQAGFRSSPSIQGDHVFFVDSLGTVRCAHAKGGTIIWKRVLGDGKPSKHNPGSSPIVWSGKLYVGVDNKLWCLNANNGASLWNIESRGRVSGTPAVATSM
jgi:outer membrane protein assembly factor BamB